MLIRRLEMVQGKTTAEHILDIVRLLKEDVEQMRKQLGDEAMQPIDKRLTRIETKITSMLEGDYRQDDGMDRKL